MTEGNLSNFHPEMILSRGLIHLNPELSKPMVARTIRVRASAVQGQHFKQTTEGGNVSRTTTSVTGGMISFTRVLYEESM